MSLSTVWSPGPNPPPTDQANHSQIPAARKPVCELIERLKQALKKRNLKNLRENPTPNLTRHRRPARARVITHYVNR